MLSTWIPFKDQQYDIIIIIIIHYIAIYDPVQVRDLFQLFQQLVSLVFLFLPYPFSLWPYNLIKYITNYKLVCFVATPISVFLAEKLSYNIPLNLLISSVYCAYAISSAFSYSYLLFFSSIYSKIHCFYYSLLNLFLASNSWIHFKHYINLHHQIL